MVLLTWSFVIKKRSGIKNEVRNSRMYIKVLGIILCGIIFILTVGCMSVDFAPATSSMEEERAPQRKALEEADPETAVKEIYASFEEYSTRRLDDEGIKEIFGLEPIYYTEAYVYYSSPMSGLADIAVIKPVGYARENVRSALYIYRDRRVEEFINYNILNSYGIAQDAIIYDRGEYVIMLMTRDNDGARAIVDFYIPQ